MLSKSDLPDEEKEQTEAMRSGANLPRARANSPRVEIHLFNNSKSLQTFFRKGFVVYLLHSRFQC